MSWTETELHDWLARTIRPERRLAAPFGSDAVTFRPHPERVVVCCDQTIEGVHYTSDVTPARAGAKAAARALSDLAASGARPDGILLALVLPREADARAIRAGIGGLRRRARKYGAELVGGDLACAGTAWHWSVTALGRQPTTRGAIGRHGARAGDLLVSTGPTGGAQLGRHLAIEPRLEVGRFLFEAGARAMLDTSDGAAIDLERLARASEVAIELDELPVHRDARRAAAISGKPAWHHALVDGEDHELFATFSAKAWSAASSAAAKRFGRLRVIGRVRRGRGVHWTNPEGARLRLAELGGWVHG